MNADAIAQAASLLVAADTTRRPLERLPEACRPTTVEDSLAIQRQIVEQRNDRVAGWKVGAVVDGTLTCGVLLASRVLRSPARLDPASAPLLGMESEIAFRFHRDLPPRDAPYTYDELAAHVVPFAAIEVVATRFASYKDTPFLERLADCMSNGAFVIGPEQERWRDLDLAALPVTLRFDDTIVVQRIGGHPAGDPLLPALALANVLRTTTGVAAGQCMTTGTYTGLEYARSGMRIRTTFDGVGSVEVHAEPRA